ncbi:hypothetical protein [Methyloversatilis sp.]|uniref:hypothetical protein n=1 Tax=Methyloversatilis sp. TaxID=2569862 RepID=UPI002736138C|nr:hypothetical protein [Methyloversatilis sp.]MDP3457035.1 hypothetical protein [Methyloversatilis sp.]
MKGNYKFINDFQGYRYLVTIVCNDVIRQVTTFSSADASSYLELKEVNLTYHELDRLLPTHLGLTSDVADTAANASQQLRNYRSTLNSFLAFVGKTTDSRVGVELTTQFDESLSQYTELLDVAPSTRRDRRSHMKRYHELFCVQRDNAKKPLKRTTTLSETLREAIAKRGVPPKTLAKSIGVSTSAVQRYLVGALPNRRGVPGLRRLEAALGLDRDSLTKLVKEDADKDDAREIPVAEDEFRLRLAKNTADTYYLAYSDICSRFELEWREFFAYKTAVSPIFERSEKGAWRLIPANLSSIESPLLKMGSAVSPTAKIALDRLRAFFGYLARPIETGGRSIPSASTQSLAWLVVPAATNGYLEFITHRSAGLVHFGQKGFAQFISSLANPKTGYLRQRPELRSALPMDVRPETAGEWDRLCDHAYKAARQWIQRAKDMSREPDAPIASLLALDAPLQPVIAAVERIGQLAARAPSGGLVQARHKRDALLIAFVISNPLRLRSLQSLTWKPDNTGSIYRTPAGWRVRLSRPMLKNGDGKAGKRYDVAIAMWVGNLIEEYVEEFRGTLLAKSQSTYFFVANRRAKPWKEMSRHVLRLTTRHVPATNGFSLHAFRHLVATDLLKRHPNGFVTAAVLLNDSPETVIRSYAHLQRDDSFVVHHDYLETLCKPK